MLQQDGARAKHIHLSSATVTYFSFSGLCEPILLLNITLKNNNKKKIRKWKWERPLQKVC